MPVPVTSGQILFKEYVPSHWTGSAMGNGHHIHPHAAGDDVSEGNKGTVSRKNGLGINTPRSCYSRDAIRAAEDAIVKAFEG